MHSRYFLHRTPTEPRASVMPPEPGPELAVGFVDVGGQDASVTDARSRGPVGFAPSERRFVTELSFRRTTPVDAPAPQVHASSADEQEAHPLPFGYTTGGQPADPAEHEQSGNDVDVVKAAESPRAEHVPFYKREITLRRRKHNIAGPADSAMVGGADDSEPESHETAGDEPAVPFGFAAPTDDHDGATEETELEHSAEVVARLGRYGAESDSDLESEDEIDDPAESDMEISADASGDDADDTVEPDDAADAISDDVGDDELELVAEADADPEREDDEPTITAEAEFDEDDEAAVTSEADLDDDELESVIDEEVAASRADLDELLGVGATAAADTPIDEPLPLTDDDYASFREAGLDPFDELDDLEPAPTGKRGRREKAPKAPKPKRAKQPSSGGRGGKRTVGLKIGSSQLAAAVVMRQDDRNTLLQLARTPLDPGIVVDGEVRDADGLKDALKAFFAEHQLPRRDVRIGVSSNRVGVRTVDITGIDDDERFDNAVRFKAHEVLPVSFSESALDYRVVEERLGEDGEVTKRVLLVVAPRDQVDPFATACAGVGIRLSAVDLEALGLLRAFVAPQAPGSRLATDTATVVVAIGHESTTLLVAGGGLCEFTRVFDWGGLAMQQSIAQELDLMLPEAATILHGLSLSGPGRTSLDEEMRQRALDAVRTRLTPFARELVSSLQFYQSQTASLGIGEIVITGGASHLEGLADALHQMIGVAVRVGDPLERLALGTPVDPDYDALIGSFAVPVGLAIEDEPGRTVNLVPDELRKVKRKKPNPLQVVLPAVVVLPLAAMGFMFMQASGDVSDQKSSLANVQAAIDSLPEPTRPEIDPALAGIQQQRAASLAQILGGRLAWDRVLGDMSRVLPANVWLTTMSAKLPDDAAAALPAAVAGTPPATATGVQIQGYTYSVPDVALLLGRLGALPSMTNITLAGTEEKKVGKRTAVAFTILADIARTGGAQ